MTQNTPFNEKDWESSIKEQLIICTRYNVKLFPVDAFEFIGLSDSLNGITINGLRHPPEQRTAGWYIWADELQEVADFFKPHHIYHLLETKPQILKYLGLPPGYRFLIDNNGYEDVWYDSSLLLI